MIISGATVVTSLDPVRVSSDDVHVQDGRIVAEGGRQRRDCSGCLVVPGNVCAHTHLYSALARGMPYDLDPPEDFLQILQRVWWRLDRALDEDSVRASALVGGMEALLTGTTTLVDHHASPNAIDGSLDVIEEALSSLGVRSVLCYETSDRDGLERAEAGLAENRRFAKRVRREQPPLARALIGAHASFTLSDDTLAACALAARDLESATRSSFTVAGSPRGSRTPERSTTARCSRTASTSTSTRSRSSTQRTRPSPTTRGRT
jgi:cytosine/adenosine deaminase-related metal-dependent hydrolase